MKDPETSEEWQEAVNGAAFLLAVDSARLYGLVDSDIQVNTDRCAKVLARGATLGYHPDPLEDLVARYVSS